MKITNLKITNYCGIRHLDVKLQKPVLLVSGKNGAGKSSLQDAIRMALLADLGRVGLKKDSPALIRDGADMASISVINADGDEYAVTVAKGGKITDSMAGRQADTVLPYLLDMTAFAKADSNARRQLLSEITRTAPTPELIKQRLHERGCESDKVASVEPMLRAGIEAACKHAKQQATEAKGAWRAITGETYGEKKAADWKAAVPTVDGDETALVAQRDLVEAEIESLRNDCAALRADIEQENRNAALRAELTEKAGRVDRIRKKLEIDQAELGKWSAKVEETKAKASGKQTPKLFDCPCCSAKLYHDATMAAKLLAWSDDEQVADPQAAAMLPEYERSLASYQRAVDNDKRDLAEAEKAAAQLATLPAAKDIDGLRAKLAQVEQIGKAKKEMTAKIGVELMAIIASRREADQAASKTAKAAGFHADVVAWTKIADALSPDGIPGELIAGALKPVNDRLRQSSADSGWAQVAIDADMNVTANGRPYALLSESEQWRTDAMLTEAVAHVSGQQMLMLDRMDVLDLPGRGECLAWLEILAENNEISTAVVCATLKAAPADRVGVQVVWLDGGEVLAMQEAA